MGLFALMLVGSAYSDQWSWQKSAAASFVAEAESRNDSRYIVEYRPEVVPGHISVTEQGWDTIAALKVAGFSPQEVAMPERRLIAARSTRLPGPLVRWDSPSLPIHRGQVELQSVNPGKIDVSADGSFTVRAVNALSMAPVSVGFWELDSMNLGVSIRPDAIARGRVVLISQGEYDRQDFFHALAIAGGCELNQTPKGLDFITDPAAYKAQWAKYINDSVLPLGDVRTLNSPEKIGVAWKALIQNAVLEATDDLIRRSLFERSHKGFWEMAEFSKMSPRWKAQYMALKAKYVQFGQWVEKSDRRYGEISQFIVSNFSGYVKEDDVPLISFNGPNAEVSILSPVTSFQGAYFGFSIEAMKVQGLIDSSGK
jgi:hypothetical protein